MYRCQWCREILVFRTGTGWVHQNGELSKTYIDVEEGRAIPIEEHAALPEWIGERGELLLPPDVRLSPGS